MTADNELDRIAAEFLQAVEHGQNPVPAEWLARHPAHAGKLAEFFADLGRFGSFLGLPSRSSLDETTDLSTSSERAGDGGRFGDYELLGEVGRGAMGAVYRARLKGTNLVVALKQLLAGGIDGPTATRRFREEVENASGFRHPNIVPIYHVGEHAGRPYYTMELIEGGSLDRHMARYRDNSRASASLVRKVAEAVHYAHQRRILHRDLKPGNVLLDEQGEPHVADFGLAMQLDETGAARSGPMGGSLPWMAPEAVRGGTTLTTSVDVWALGVILYELLTGARPFVGVERNLLRRAILDSGPRPPREINPQIDRDLAAICQRCLVKDPDGRYESASGLARDLERWERGEPVRARKADRAERFLKWGKRNPSVASSIAFLAIVTAAGVLAAFSMAHDQEARLRSEVCRGNEYAAQHVASTVLARLHQYGDAVEAASDDDGFQRACVAGDWQAVEGFLRSRLLNAKVGPNAPTFATAFVLDPEGTIRVELPQQHVVVGGNFSERDYFRGAQGRADRPGGERLHLSRVFTSKNDGLDKLALSVPFRPPSVNGEVWVLGATVPTDATLGLGGLNDERRKAVLLARRESSEESPEFVVLVHPGYSAREPSIPFPAGDLQRTDNGYAANDDFADPVAFQHPEYRGRWLAGFATVPDTELVVLVEQPYNEAVAPYRAFFRRFLEWLTAGAVAGVVLVGGLWLLRVRRQSRSRFCKSGGGVHCPPETDSERA
jgi:eukaryotic-like serine/threonine-protein kinase